MMGICVASHVSKKFTCSKDALRSLSEARVGEKERRMTKSDVDSVTGDLQKLRAGSQSSTGRIVQRYWGRLQRLVQPRVRWYGRPAVSVDEDDVANAALNSVIDRLQGGKYPGVVDQDSLWRMLAKFAVRKAGRLVKKWNGHPPTQSLSATNSFPDSSRSPSSRVATAEEKERLIDAIRAFQPPRFGHPSSEELAQLVHLLAEDHDIPEIAKRLDVARCTIYRWIGLVRKIGEQQGIARQSVESAPQAESDRRGIPSGLTS
jgi:ECF sigma factor